MFVANVMPGAVHQPPHSVQRSFHNSPACQHFQQMVSAATCKEMNFSTCHGCVVNSGTMGRGDPLHLALWEMKVVSMIKGGGPSNGGVWRIVVVLT